MVFPKKVVILPAVHSLTGRENVEKYFYETSFSAALIQIFLVLKYYVSPPVIIVM
jgi:hypothetical protein